MASHSRGKLPNLKICVDNTNEDDSEDEITDEKDVHIIVQTKERNRKVPGASNTSSSDSDSEGSSSGSSSSGSSSSDSGSDGDASDAESVEFNVRISGLAKGDSANKRKEIEKRYENKTGNFITGIDLTSREAIEKKDERAKRFGITNTENTVEVDREALLKSLGIKQDDLDKSERGIRLEAIHMRGTDDMSTQDIFHYFNEFAPGRIEWIDDSSCNVVWFDPLTAARALSTLSTDYHTVIARENTTDHTDIKNNTEKPENIDENKEKEKQSKPENIDTVTSKEEEMDVDDELDLNADTDNESDEVKEKFDQNKNGSKSKEEEDIVPEKNAEKDTEEKENKAVRKEKREQNTKKKIVWPPGKWRLGQPTSKAKSIFLRYATKADKKILGAENKSKYYIKYGNPNYGGQKGLISASRKRKIRAKRRNEEYESVKNVSRRDKYSDSEPEIEQVEVLEKPKELFTESNKSRASLPSTEDIDDLDMEAELQELLGRPVKKRSMRMYADDIEDAKKSRPRISTGGLTIVAESRPSIESRLGREVDSDTRDARFKITDARDRLSSSKYRKHSDYSPYTRSNADLRSRLKHKRSNTPDNLADIKIEIFE